VVVEEVEQEAVAQILYLCVELQTQAPVVVEMVGVRQAALLVVAVLELLLLDT
jgi:hypothetical protein